jgi:signal transduction histidine kinase
MTGIGARWWLLVVVLVHACAAAPAGASTHLVNVLILLPGQPGLPAPMLIATGARSRLLAELTLRVSFDTEYVDVRRFASSAEAERRMHEAFASTHEGRRYDVIIAAGHEPLGFLIRARDTLWPRTPVVVCAIDDRTVGRLVVPRGMTVVTTRYDVEGTLRAALALLPDTEHVVLMGGAGPADRPFRDLFHQAFAGRADLIDLSPLPLADLLVRASALPDKSVVFISAFQSDGGRSVYGLEMMDPLARAANRPMFNMFNHVLGRGIVGGSMTDFEALGREAGDVALRALRGETLPAVIPSGIPSVLRFDGRQLARWGIDERRLPAGSEVLYPQATVWSQYRWHIVAGIGLIAVQAGLIAGLLLQRSRRRDVQRQLAAGLRFEGLVREIGAALNVVPTARLGEQMQSCLHQVATRLGADAGAVWRPIADDTALELLYYWSADGVAPPPVFVDVNRFPYLASRLRSPGGVVSVNGVQDLPPDATEDRAALAAHGVDAVAAVPLCAADRVLGVLGFASMRGSRAWPLEFLRQFAMLAECFTNALVRADNAAALESSDALIDAVLAVLPGATAVVDRSGRIIKTNDAWTRAVGATHGGPRDPDVMATEDADRKRIEALCAIGIPPGLVEHADLGIRSVIRGEQDESTVEYASARHAHGRWFELRVRRLRRLDGGAAVMNVDVTARRQTEAALQRHLAEIAHSDRVAAVGQLAASMAHELSQPMAAILTNAQAAQRLLDRPDVDVEEIRACLADIVSDDRRAAEVIHRTRDLLRKTKPSASPVALNDLVATTIGLVTNEALLRGVSLAFTPAPALPVIRCDMIQVQQVILNLLSNAIDAAAAGRDARRVTVRTAIEPPSAVALTVHDTGSGIPPADMDHLFEPFFTTKPEGLGMGLPISHSIVEAHGGRLQARNDEDGGATFSMVLPIDPPDTRPEVP